MVRRIFIGLFLAGALVLVPTALAGKGGNGHGGGGGNAEPSPAWVGASPTPAAVGDRVWLSGCGYQFTSVQVRITAPSGSAQSYFVGMWSTGCMDTNYFVAREAGTYHVEVWQANSKNLVLMASTSLSVA